MSAPKLHPLLPLGMDRAKAAAMLSDLPTPGKTSCIPGMRLPATIHRRTA